MRAVRCVDFNIAPGVQADMGDSDQWPQIREKVLAADILVVATPRLVVCVFHNNDLNQVTWELRARRR